MRLTIIFLVLITFLVQGASADFGSLIDTTSYDAFGFTYQVNSTHLIHITRAASVHEYANDGKIVATFYNITSGSWSGYTTIYDSIYDDRNVAGGAINSTLYAFLSRMNATHWVDAGYITSNDSGITWSRYTALNVQGLQNYTFYGKLINVSGNYIIPFYGDKNNLGIYQVGFFNSTDGISWMFNASIYNGTIPYTETSIEYIGNNRLIASIRKDNNGSGAENYVYQSVSSDGGQTWSPVTQTNLGSVDPHSKIPWLLYDPPNLLLLYADREHYYINFTKADANAVFSSTTAWETPKILYWYYGLDNMYPSFVKISGNNYYMTWAIEKSSTDTDLYGGIYNVPETRYKMVM